MTETRLRTLEDAEDWLRSAQPGNRCIYHSGLLMRDREGRTPDGGFTDNAKEVHRIGRRMWRATIGGAVVLVQRRVGEGACDYIAERIGVRKETVR